MPIIDIKKAGIVMGILVILLGMGLIAVTSSGTWSLQVVIFKTMGVLIGACICGLGAFIVVTCLGILDNIRGLLKGLRARLFHSVENRDSRKES